MLRTRQGLRWIEWIKTGRIVWAAQYDACGAATIVTPNATQDKPTISSNPELPGQYVGTMQAF